MSQSVLLSKENPNWLTPLDIVQRSRVALGGIDFDPATSPEANAPIGARYICYGPGHSHDEVSGLNLSWLGNVFLNPPGGVISTSSRTKSSPVAWWLKLVEEVERGNVKKAIFLAFAAGSFLQSLQKAKGFRQAEWPLSSGYSSCFLKDRIRFELTHADKLAMLEKELEPLRSDAPGRVKPLTLKEVKRAEKLKKEIEVVEATSVFSRFPGPSPTHGNLIVGVNIEKNLFKSCFSSIGQCQ